MGENYVKALLLLIAVILIIRYTFKLQRQNILKKTSKPFSQEWRNILMNKVLFYKKLSKEDKSIFEKRILLFFATKKIEGIDTIIDDSIRLMVAASAIIPMFAFPDFNYPGVREVLIYPNSFDEKFQTKRYKGHEEFISGMVGNRAMHGTVILSKPDLIAAYDGIRHKKNVGIHEFVHLIDGTDGAIDGIPKHLIKHSYTGPWLHEIKAEMHRIEKGKSDINPYAITNNAEFLAVVSEYFFDNPEKFKSRHAALYNYLVTIFHQKL